MRTMERYPARTLRQHMSLLPSTRKPERCLAPEGKFANAALFHQASALTDDNDPVFEQNFQIHLLSWQSQTN
jgi:hypothetical protein